MHSHLNSSTLSNGLAAQGRKRLSVNLVFSPGFTFTIIQVSAIIAARVQPDFSGVPLNRQRNHRIDSVRAALESRTR